MRLALLEAQLAEHGIHAVDREDAHQVVLQAQEEGRMARIALAAGTATQLVVDAAGFMALGADDHQATGGQRLGLVGGDGRLDIGDLGVALGAFETLGLALDAHFEIAAELDIGAATGHVGGDGDGARQAGIGDDEGFLLVVAGIQHVHRADILLAQQLGQHFRLLDRGRADQHRLAAILAFLDQVGDGVELLGRGAEDGVFVVLARTGTLVGMVTTSSL